MYPYHYPQGFSLAINPLPACLCSATLVLHFGQRIEKPCNKPNVPEPEQCGQVLCALLDLSWTPTP